MDEFLDGLVTKLRLSGMVADSIMMGIVNSAMEQAFQKACSKEGDIERLNEKSRFCELAVMQLELCLKFVQEETDSYVVVESGIEREKLVLELKETRDRIQRRLEETEFMVVEKDRELCERVESEIRLKHLLELRERELGCLCEELERRKSYWVGGGDDDRDGDFLELKNSLDEQFFSIKQTLEDERINLTNGGNGEGNLSTGNTDTEFYDENYEIETSNCSKFGIKKMDSDIDALKGTLDLAFGVMGNAISLSEQGPEQQWRSTIEKDTLGVVLRGFLMDVQEDHQEIMREERKWKSPVLLGEDWSELMNGVKSLRNELDILISHDKDRVKAMKHSPETNNVSSAVNKPEFPCLEIGELRHREEPSKEDQSEHWSLVAKMVQNHESIIRQKSEELNWLKGEIIREKGCSSVKNEKGHDTLKERVQEVILRLDSIISSNENYFGTYDDYRCVQGNDSINDELRQLKQETEESNLKSVIVEDIYFLLFKSFVKELCLELYNSDAETILREDMCKVFLREMIKEFNEKVRSVSNETHINEEVNHVDFSEAVGKHIINQDNNINDSPYSHELVQSLEAIVGADVCTVFLQETIKEWNNIVLNEAEKGKDRAPIFTPREYEDPTNQRNLLNGSPYMDDPFQNIEVLLRDDVGTVFLRETIKEWIKAVEIFRFESAFEKNIYQIVLSEVVKNIDSMAKSALGECQKIKIHYKFQEESSSTAMVLQSVESQVREDVYTHFYKEMVKECMKQIENNNIKNLIQKDVYQILICESVKDINSYLAKFEEVKNQKLDSLSKCLEVEEDLMLRASCELTDRIVHTDLLDFEHENLYEGNTYCDGEVLDSVSNKLEKALQQILVSKTLLEGLGYCFGIEIKDLEEVYDQTAPVIETIHNIQQSLSLRNMNEEVGHGFGIEVVDLEDVHDQRARVVDAIQNSENSFSFRSTDERVQIDEMGYVAPIIETVQNIEYSLSLRNMNEEVGCSCGIEIRDFEEVDDQTAPVIDITQNNKHSLSLRKMNEDAHIDRLGSVVTSIMEVSRSIGDFECIMHENVELHISRLEEIEHHSNLYRDNVTLIRKSELLYRKAFMRRCYDLQKAENEVDLLADEVDALLGLLEKLYLALDHYSPVLQHYSGIIETLALIRKELNGSAAATPHL
ncbi:hypothetical protein GIB67_027655 [Kingdonia uniflora]|uniref:WPP domain-associated protein n=1 Tax=Kingdonia uniflora TaxID=39325 RepID=A0A7J7NL05_9MAGN|nr:hypothetical protein GIB67_027655 [Kingdonia uniflora]